MPPRKKRLPQVKKVYYTPGFHSDVVWLEDQRDYAEVLMGSARQYLTGCEVDPDYGVFLHELTYLKPYMDVNPAQRELIRRLIRDGRVGTGGAHSLPTEALISGEGFIRNIQYGRLYHEQVLGDEPEILMLWDIFGHCSQLPQIALGCRFKGIVWSKNIRGVHPLFWQLGPDGSQALVRRQIYGHGRRDREHDLEYVLNAAHEMASLGHDVDMRIDANDFQPPRGWLIGACGELRTGVSRAGSPRHAQIVVSGQAHRRYFRDVKRAERKRKVFIPTTARDFEWHHQGTGVAHIDFKIANRCAENLLANAEKFASVASFLGADYPHVALDKAWRQVMFNQHHDAITGPCCDRSYVDIMAGYREALELAGTALHGALGYIGGAIKRQDRGVPIGVFNSNNWERTDVAVAQVTFRRPVKGLCVLDDRGEAVPAEIEAAEGPAGKIKAATVRFLATVPSLGYRVYYVVPARRGDAAAEPVAEADDATVIENDFLRLEVDPDRGGGITSLYDKQADRELIPPGEAPANELIAIEEDMSEHDEPPWEVYTKPDGHKALSRHYRAVVERRVGPVSQRLRITSDFHDCGREQEIVLYRGVRRIEFVTDLKAYRGREYLHVVTFPNNIQGAVPVFDDRFNCVVKRKGKGYLDYRTWQWRNYSDCGARRAYQWLDLSSSVTLQFVGDDAPAGEVALGNTSLVIANDRETERAAQTLQAALIGKGVPVTIFYDDCDRERREALPHEDSCLPLEHPNEDLPWGTSFRIILDVGESNLLWRELAERLPAKTLDAVRARREAHGWAAAFVYDGGMPDDWPPLPTLIVTARTVGELHAAARSLAGQIRRRARVTLPAETNCSGQSPHATDCGLGLFNRGTPLCSVEHDNTLVLILMHAVSWARTHQWGPDRLPFHLVAEHKDHRFEYALYPHPGNWRDARTPHEAYDYNNPLIAQPLGIGSPTRAFRGRRLPERLSFLQTSDGPIVTALKAPGFPLAGYDTPAKSPREFALRLYEPAGERTPLEVSFFAGLRSARRANLLDEPLEPEKLSKGAVSGSVSPSEIRTILLRPQASATTGPSETLAPEREQGLVHFKHWQHNVGAGPLGFSPIGLSLSGEVLTGVKISQGGVTTNRLTVGVSNNLPRRWRGDVAFETAPGWRVEPETLPFDLPAGQGAEQHVCLVFDSDRRRGLVKARLEHDGQVYQDVLEVGDPLLLEWDVAGAEDALTVSVTNPHENAIEADLFVVSPHETYGSSLVGSAAMGCLAPWRRSLQLPPGGAERIEAALPRGTDMWVVVKLAYNGRVEYKMLRAER